MHIYTLHLFIFALLLFLANAQPTCLYILPNNYRNDGESHQRNITYGRKKRTESRKL